MGFVGDIKTIASELETAGAKNILIWNVPNIGKTPAVLAAGPLASVLGTRIASVMNDALLTAIGGDPDIKLFDIFTLMNDAIADPGAFGLSDVTDACARFVTCDPSRFLFWDGIHPTSATEIIISDAILSLVVPEPSTLALLAVALLGFGVIAVPATSVFRHRWGDPGPSVVAAVAALQQHDRRNSTWTRGQVGTWERQDRDSDAPQAIATLEL